MVLGALGHLLGPGRVGGGDEAVGGASQASHLRCGRNEDVWVQLACTWGAALGVPCIQGRGSPCQGARLGQAPIS